jgi:hypothetical protein
MWNIGSITTSSLCRQSPVKGRCRGIGVARVTLLVTLLRPRRRTPVWIRSPTETLVGRLRLKRWGARRGPAAGARRPRWRRPARRAAASPPGDRLEIVGRTRTPHHELAITESLPPPTVDGRRADRPAVRRPSGHRGRCHIVLTNADGRPGGTRPTAGQAVPGRPAESRSRLTSGPPTRHPNGRQV